MKIKGSSVIAMCIILVCTSAQLNAEKRRVISFPLMAQHAQLIDGGRDVVVHLHQLEIATTIDTGRVASSAQSGGLLDSMIIHYVDDKKKIMSETLNEKAQITVAPLRKALADFDVNALALETTKVSFSKIPWYGLHEISVAPVMDARSQSESVINVSTGQVASVMYHYELSPDFSSIRVDAYISLVRNNNAEASKKIDYKPMFSQTVSSVVQLGTRSYDNDVNVASWSENNGKRARAALTAGFEKMEMLISRILSINAAEMKIITAKNREKAFGAGLYGPLVDINKDMSANILIWKNGLVNIHTIQ